MSGLTCCRRHRAGLPLVGDDVAIRCGDLDGVDCDRLGDAAEDAALRAEAATPGPWTHARGSCGVDGKDGIYIVGAVGVEVDGAFIAAAREDVTSLAAALLAALEQLAAVTLQRDTARGSVGLLETALALATEQRNAARLALCDARASVERLKAERDEAYAALRASRDIV